jgi:hypothetical protein
VLGGDSRKGGAEPVYSDIYRTHCRACARKLTLALMSHSVHRGRSLATAYTPSLSGMTSQEELTTACKLGFCCPRSGFVQPIASAWAIATRMMTQNRITMMRPLSMSDRRMRRKTLALRLSRGKHLELVLSTNKVEVIIGLDMTARNRIAGLLCYQYAGRPILLCGSCLHQDLRTHAKVHSGRPLIC